MYLEQEAITEEAYMAEAAAVQEHWYHTNKEEFDCSVCGAICEMTRYEFDRSKWRLNVRTGDYYCPSH